MHQVLAIGQVGGGGGQLPGSKSVDGGVVTVSNGATSQAVVFAVAFTTAPAPNAKLVLANNTESGIDVWPDFSTLTTAGVTFLFAVAVPDGTYRLSWSAIGS